MIKQKIGILSDHGRRGFTFLLSDIWRLRLEDISGPKAFGIKHLRILLLSLRKFVNDDCTLMAAALTLYALLSIVPLVAIAFGIAKGFGIGDILKNRLMAEFYGQEAIMEYIITFSQSWLESIRGGIVAITGGAALLYTVIKMLSSIEMALNTTWNIDKHRRLTRKTSDFVVVFLLCLLLLIMSSTINIFISTQVKMIMERSSLLAYFGPGIMFLLKLLPYTLMWILFTFLYMTIPNTRVNLKAALPAGIIGGTLFQLAQVAIIGLQIGVGRYNIVYGSFAAFPLFLVWLQISWTLFLFGSELAFAFQNHNVYEFEPDSHRISAALKEKLLLTVLQQVVNNFAEAGGGVSEEDILRKTHIPLCLARSLLEELETNGLVVKINDNKRDSDLFQPAHDINLMNLQYIREQLAHRGIDHLEVVESEIYEQIAEALNECSQTAASCLETRLLKDIGKTAQS